MHTNKAETISSIHRDEIENQQARQVILLDNFFPSKNRHVYNNAISGAAQNQLSGNALPSLVLGDWATPQEHLNAARLVNPSADLINVALSEQVKSIISMCATDPTRTISKRADAIAQFHNFATTLGPLRARWTHTLPLGSPARSFHFPLMYFLTNTLEYPDKRFIRDLANGMPIAGPIETTPGLVERKKHAELSYLEWKKGIPARNQKIIERVKKTQGTELAIEGWNKTLNYCGK